jgi:hypothetical protein
MISWIINTALIIPFLQIFGVTKLLKVMGKFATKAESLHDKYEDRGNLNPHIECQAELFTSDEAIIVYKTIIVSNLIWLIVGFLLGISIIFIIN